MIIIFQKSMPSFILLFFVFDGFLSGQTNDPARMFALDGIVYELHSDRLALTLINVLNENSMLYQFLIQHEKSLSDTAMFNSPLFEFTFPDLYSKTDIVELLYSKTIAFCVISCYDSLNWRGEKLFNPKFNWRAKALDPVVGYWVQGVVKRLPHLHTTDPISPGRVYDLGINLGSNAQSDRNFRLLAFPKDTKILETYGAIAGERLDYDTWTLLYYSIPDGRRASLHVRFILPSARAPQLSIERLITFIASLGSEENYGDQ
ncbi:MAG: hypothetical protein JW795_01920 [Chitinivibrionales bacterium]|nr:hypothetical protein [Chitinivibrionales bacterium]